MRRRLGPDVCRGVQCARWRTRSARGDGYAAWFTGEHFVDSIGWPLALVAFGLVLIGLNVQAFRIDRDYVRPKH